MSKVAIIMGSISDKDIMDQAKDALGEFNISVHFEVVSAHRTPQRMMDFASKAKVNGIDIIIAGAGGAAHLPGMVASLTSVPVIGVPILSSNSLQGWDSLLSIAQMPKGVPVATMAVGGGYNAGLLAVKMLAIKDENLFNKLETYRDSLKDKVKKMNESL